MIEKILDKYYTKKVVEQIKSNMIIYMIDKKFEYKNNCLTVYVKKKLIKNQYYWCIFKMRYEDSLYYFIHIEDVIKEIHKQIKDYIENNDNYNNIMQKKYERR